MDLLIPVDPTEMSDIDSPEAPHDTPRAKKTKKNEEAQDVSITLAKTASISPDQGGYGKEIDGVKVE
jgi:hypothetical protein